MAQYCVGVNIKNAPAGCGSLIREGSPQRKYCDNCRIKNYASKHNVPINIAERRLGITMVDEKVSSKKKAPKEEADKGPSRYQLVCSKCGKTVKTRPDRYDKLEAEGKVKNYLCRDCKPKPEKKVKEKAAPKEKKEKNASVKKAPKKADGKKTSKKK